MKYGVLGSGSANPKVIHDSLLDLISDDPEAVFVIHARRAPQGAVGDVYDFLVDNECKMVSVHRIDDNAPKALLNASVEVVKTEDPAQYSIKRAEMEDRAKEIQQTKMEAARSAQNWQAQQKRERDIALAEQLEVEHQRLLDKLPEWRSEKVAGDERQRIVSYLTTDDVGFSTDELQHAADHRLIVIARKAMLYDEQQGKVKVTEKKLKSIPKVMKPGSKQDGGQVSKKKVDSLRARLRNSKSTRDSLAIAMELRKEQLKQK